MNVVSLFDGMSCGRIALDRAGLVVDNYYSSEIDKPAEKTSAANYPDILRMGDITKWREWDINWASIDLLLGGSPCQGFSFAGKQLAFDDPRSVLFFVYAEILNHIKSVNSNVKFLLENVKMKKQFIDVISGYVDCAPVFINSSTVSACSRPRYYWANFPITQPTAVDVAYLDVVDGSLTENTMSDGWHNWFYKNEEYQIKKGYCAIPSGREKGVCMTTRQYASWNGNFIKTPTGKMRKPTKEELAMLIGAPSNYFDSASQRQTEVMTGNGWTVPVITHILEGLNGKI